MQEETIALIDYYPEELLAVFNKSPETTRHFQIKYSKFTREHRPNELHALLLKALYDLTHKHDLKQFHHTYSKLITAGEATKEFMLLIAQSLVEGDYCQRDIYDLLAVELSPHRGVGRQ